MCEYVCVRVCLWLRDYMGDGERIVRLHVRGLSLV